MVVSRKTLADGVFEFCRAWRGGGGSRADEMPDTKMGMDPASIILGDLANEPISLSLLDTAFRLLVFDITTSSLRPPKHHHRHHHHG